MFGSVKLNMGIVWCLLALCGALFGCVDAELGYPPNVFDMSNKQRIVIPSITGCSGDPMVVSGMLPAVSDEPIIGLVYHTAGLAQQTYFTFSTDGYSFSDPVLLVYVFSNARSVAAVIHDGQLWISWNPVEAPYLVDYATFDGVNALPQAGPTRILTIISTNYPPAFGFAVGDPSILSLVFSLAQYQDEVWVTQYTNGSWGTATPIQSKDQVSGTVGVGQSEDVTLVTYRPVTGTNGELFSFNTESNWSAAGNSANSGGSVWVNEVYSRPSTVAWALAALPEAMFAIFTSNFGQLHYKYYKKSTNTFPLEGPITYQAQTITPFSAPTTVVYKPKGLMIYWCQMPDSISANGELTVGVVGDY